TSFPQPVAGLVPAIHVFLLQRLSLKEERRGPPGQSPGEGNLGGSRDATKGKSTRPKQPRAALRFARGHPLPNRAFWAGEELFGAQRGSVQLSEKARAQ